ncbi:MAG: G-protein coupled receptor, partial [Proteobacteria bacterium]|nr:G-protein coupled receptor [Pseudomonadota bacterium]
MNVSDSSLSEFTWILDSPLDPNFDNIANGYAIATILILFMLVGLPWNLWVLSVILHKSLYSQPIVMLMLNLTITNILLILMVMPFVIVTGYASEFIFGPTDSVRCRVCQIGVVNIILPNVSVHTLSLMSIDRLLYLKRPFDYKNIVTPRKMLAAIAFIWLLCIVIALPPLFGFGTILFSYAVASCVPIFAGESPLAPNIYYVLAGFGEVIFPLIILFVAYIWILCIARKNLFRKLQRNLHFIREDLNKALSSAYNRDQFQLVQIFGAIFIANVITWFPTITLSVVVAIQGEGPTLLYTIAYLSFLSETMVHPIIEARMIKDIWSVTLKFVS